MTIGQPLPRPDGPRQGDRARAAMRPTTARPVCSTPCWSPRPSQRDGSRQIDVDRRAGRARRGARPHARGHAGLRRWTAPPPAQSFMPMQGDEIRHEGQPVAIVLGETLEAAEAGARRVEVRYERREAGCRWRPMAALDEVAVAPRASDSSSSSPSSAKADADAGARRAEQHRGGRLPAALTPSQCHGAVGDPCRMGRRFADGARCHPARLWRPAGPRRAPSSFPPRMSASSRSTPAAASAARATPGRMRCWPPPPRGSVGRPVKLVLSRANLYSVPRLPAAHGAEGCAGRRRCGRLAGGARTMSSTSPP